MRAASEKQTFPPQQTARLRLLMPPHTLRQPVSLRTSNGCIPLGFSTSFTFSLVITIIAHNKANPPSRLRAADR
ncbi:hypothetical protein [Cupriavidus sp. IDO]|uniref:hypothetical protein n=1 Tax=Cupriavidus sp. IDO TaxID=1539142 RepID=UPI001EE6E274|nr:hypothetical protein [Cupriavidus sp. IDO]